MSSSRVLVSETVIEELRARATAAAPNETGGLLAGVTTSDGVWVTTMVEIEGVKPRHSRFDIPAGVTHDLIDALRVDDPRIGYLGDWHSHPEDVGPSGVDFATLRDLTAGVFGPRRLLGLVRFTEGGWSVGLWRANRLRPPARAIVELAGPLPRAVTSTQLTSSLAPIRQGRLVVNGEDASDRNGDTSRSD